MVEQTTIFDKREEAISRSAVGANAEWLHEARDAVELLCRRGQPFTTDGVHYLMTLVNIPIKDKRALGAVMLRAAKDGLIMKTGEYRPSTRPECNGRPIPVWRPVRPAR